MSRGGARAGAGRPREGAAPRSKRTFYLSETLPKLTSAEVSRLIEAIGENPVRFKLTDEYRRITVLIHDEEDVERCAKALLNNTELEVAGVTFQPGNFIFMKY